MSEEMVEKIFDGERYIEDQINLFMKDDNNFDEIVNCVKEIKNKFKDEKFKISNSYSLMRMIIDLSTFHKFTIQEAKDELIKNIELLKTDIETKYKNN